LPESAAATYVAAADRVKKDFFGTTDMTFHEPLMRHRKGPYYFAGDTSRQAAFETAVDQLVSDADLVAFGVGVRKAAFERELAEAGLSPYFPADAYAVAIMLLLERYVDALATAAEPMPGRLVFESQDPKEDAYHQLEYARLLLYGSQWVPDASFRNWLETGARFLPKCFSHPLELADMFSRDLYEWIRDDCAVEPRRWRLWSPKIYCRADGMMGKFGAKVYPDADIREAIMAHREQCREARGD